jgi:hypothetical protein
MSKYFYPIALSILIFCLVVLVGMKFLPQSIGTSAPDQGAGVYNALTSTFTYNFSTTAILQEAGSMQESTSPYWWVNSGGELILAGGIGSTVEGALPTTNKWQRLYAQTNPMDTDNGFHPQNIFRLVTKSSWTNLQQELFFRIDNNNVSSSTNRNESNGLLLFNRYQDGATLYYTGIRVDGAAVIKKKINGIYYTMDYEPIITNKGAYDRIKNINLLPEHVWIGLRSVVKTLPNGTVQIQLYENLSGTWDLIAQAVDNGTTYGGAVISSPGHAGVRTDFMDVSFKNYSISELK